MSNISEKKRKGYQLMRDVMWALKEAEEQGAIRRIDIGEDARKKVTSQAVKTSFMLLLASIIIFAVAIGLGVALISFAHIIVFSIRIVFVYILILVFPVFAVVNIITTSVAVKKQNYSFYAGNVVTKTDKGYKISGLEDQDINFLKMAKPANESDVTAGASVIIVRIKKDLDLLWPASL